MNNLDYDYDITWEEVNISEITFELKQKINSLLDAYLPKDLSKIIVEYTFNDSFCDADVTGYNTTYISIYNTKKYFPNQPLLDEILNPIQFQNLKFQIPLKNISKIQQKNLDQVIFEDFEFLHFYYDLNNERIDFRQYQCLDISLDKPKHLNSDD